MKLRYLYLVFCLLGLLLPYSIKLNMLSARCSMIQGMNPIREKFFAFDVIVWAIVPILFIQSEGRRLGIRGFLR